MPKCPKCKIFISREEIVRENPNRFVDYYLFKCSHCGANLEISWIWFGAFFSLCCIAPLFIALAVVFGNSPLLWKIAFVVTYSFPAVIFYKLIARTLLWSIIKPVYLEPVKVERKWKWIEEAKGLYFFHDRSAIIIGIVLIIIVLLIFANWLI